MLRKLRERDQAEQGFTLIELLVVILIIGILAAIAIPSFIHQQSKGNDAEAKASAGTAAAAMEACATDNDGRYVAGCDATELKNIEPTLNNAQGLVVQPGTPARGYTVTVESKRAGNPTFTVQKSNAGTTSHTCSVPSTENKGGCSAAGSATATW